MDFLEFCEDTLGVHQLEALVDGCNMLIVLMNFLRRMETELLSLRLASVSFVHVSDTISLFNILDLMQDQSVDRFLCSSCQQPQI